MNRRAPLLVLALTATLAACSGGGGHATGTGAAGQAATGSPSTAAPETTAAAKVALIFSPALGAKDVALASPVSVSVADGKLLGVTVSGAPAGHDLAGAVNGATWTATGGLVPGTTYTLTASFQGADHETATRTSTFVTAQPAKKLTAKVAPLDGTTVGVGQPLAVYLSSPVTDKAALLAALKVTTVPAVVGAWRWVSPTELHYRPEAYWAPGTKVTLDAALPGVDFGGGTWGTEARHVAFTIGDSHVSIVDATTHLMTVSTNGQVVRTIKVSTGRDKYPTKSGVHVVLDKSETTVMDSSTVGIPAGSPDAYKETVHWNVRISNSGEFVHAAPWSIGAQGKVNVSHGCVNASPADATWFYGYSRIGDVVEVKGTPAVLEPTNGFGDWNISWATWTGGATGAAT